MRRLPIVLSIVTILWMGIHIFAHFVHPIEGKPNEITELIYNVGMLIPILLLVALMIDIANKKKKKMHMPVTIMKVLNSEKLWVIVFSIAIAVIAIFMYYTQILGHYITYRGIMTTAGVMVLIAMWTMWKYKKTIGIWQSAFVGMLAAGFAYGFMEIVYQIFRCIIWNDPAELSNFIIIINQQLYYALPFVFACMLYKIRPSKLSYLFFGMYCIFWGIWVFYYDFWSVLTNVNGVPTLTQPIRWDAYYFIRAGQVAMACSIISLGIRSKNEQR